MINSDNIMILDEGFLDSIFSSSSYTIVKYTDMIEELKKVFNELKNALSTSIIGSNLITFNSSFIPWAAMKDSSKYMPTLFYAPIAPANITNIMQKTGFSKELIISEFYYCLKNLNDNSVYFDAQLYYKDITKQDLEVVFTLRDPYVLRSLYFVEDTKAKVTEDELFHDFLVSCSYLDRLAKSNPMFNMLNYGTKLTEKPKTVFDVIGNNSNKGLGMLITDEMPVEDYSNRLSNNKLIAFDILVNLFNIYEETELPNKLTKLGIIVQNNKFKLYITNKDNIFIER